MNIAFETVFISDKVNLGPFRDHMVSLSPNQILDLLIPEEEADLSDLVLEVTAGVGGQEAMLFTAEVWRSSYII